MAWFSVLKGAYPSLQQIDKTLLVAEDPSKGVIVRGSLIYVNGGNFMLANSAQADDPQAYIYFALVGEADFTAGMAGTIGQGVAAGTAAVTGIACGQPMEFQTDQFVASPSPSWAVGVYLTVADGGLLTPCAAATDGSAGDQNIVAQCTAVPFNKWVNDAVAVANYRTGANVSVINARSMWLPNFA